MATERLSMRKTREILRQKWALGRSHREVARQPRAEPRRGRRDARRGRRAAGLDWAAVEALTDEALEARLYGPGRRRPAPRRCRTSRWCTPSASGRA